MINKKKTIYYWSPFLNKIATIDAVIDSAKSLSLYSRSFECSVINAVGEFDFLKKREKEEYKIINLTNSKLINFLPKFGYLNSRFSFLIIFLKCFLPLKEILQKKNPDYLIIHLISSLPLILLTIFNFKTKFILRISGLPKLNFFRKFLWKIVRKKIHKVTCPTEGTLNYLIKNDIFPKDKIYLLRDPVINVKKLKNQKLLDIDNKLKEKKFILAIGRLTKQKNFLFLLNCFKELNKEDPNLNLVILGDGEEKQKLENFIKLNKLMNSVFLLGHQQNVQSYLKKCEIFVLSSLWEDPGFVLIEAIFGNSKIISSNCKNGPQEILNDGKFGYLFTSNSTKSFIENFYLIQKEEEKVILRKKILAKKNILDFTMFRHHKRLTNILN